MLYYNQYVRAESLDEAYDLYQKKNNFILAGMLWQKMRNKTMGTPLICAASALIKLRKLRRRSALAHMFPYVIWRQMKH